MMTTRGRNQADNTALGWWGRIGSALWFQLSVLLVALQGCAAGLELTYVENDGGDDLLAEAAFPSSGEPDYLILRITNRGAKPVRVDWSSVHFRHPDGFEIPLEVTPKSALREIYPEAMVEYHLHPRHNYMSPIGEDGSRESRSSAIVTHQRLNWYTSSGKGYTIRVRMKVCRAGAAGCGADGAGWGLLTVFGEVIPKRGG
jgi:hypothetical protein